MDSDSVSVSGPLFLTTALCEKVTYHLPPAEDVFIDGTPLNIFLENRIQQTIRRNKIKHYLLNRCNIPKVIVDIIQSFMAE